MAITDDYVLTRLADAQGHTGNVYYVRFVEKFSGIIYDAAAKHLSASTTWEDSAIALVEDGDNGTFPIVIPKDLPAGHRYNYIVYKQAGSVPANSDDVTKQDEFDKGSDWGF